MAEPKNMSFEVFNMAAAKYEAITAGCTRELARHLLDISPPIDANSIVLDNACGTGVVAQEVLLKAFRSDTAISSITCVDAAPTMVEMARDICQGMLSTAKNTDPNRITCATMPGEKLSLPDSHFTHSFTNQGIQFFQDAPLGASEIYRTLKPGGFAIVTSWTRELGHVRAVQEAQKSYKPDAPLFDFPISEQWYQASHLEKTLRGAGFTEVEVKEKTVWYATKTREEMNALLFGMFMNFPVGWSEEENVEFIKHLETKIEERVVKVERLMAGDLTGKMEELVGFPLVGLVGVARK
jgi:ubiquinone/menaquinone biosynthesis C-methylase UbiE